MLNGKQLASLKKSVSKWNKWRRSNPDEKIQLSGADLTDKTLNGVNLSDAELDGAKLKGVKFIDANLSNANLSNANLINTNLSKTNFDDAILKNAFLCEATFTNANAVKADFCGAQLTDATILSSNFNNVIFSNANLKGARLKDTDLSNADLSNSNFNEANLHKVNLSHANLTNADFSRSCLTETNLTKANLKRCHIYGISAWDLILIDTIQTDLVITASHQPIITVDNLEVAQFIYLLLNNQRLCHVLNSITSKVILILGRFTDERKAVLNSILNALRNPPYEYIPVMFDFDKPNKGYLETINILAGMARFVIADVTDAKVVLLELDLIVKNHPSVPVQPILLSGTEENVMISDFNKYDSYLSIHIYTDEYEAINMLSEKVIRPAELMVEKLQHH